MDTLLSIPSRRVSGRLNQLCGIALVAMALLSESASCAVHTLKSIELKLFRSITHDPGQQRKSLKLDPILCVVARHRAADMAKRNYFSHINPDGNGPDLLVRNAGYILPYERSNTANHIESIALAPSNVNGVLDLWKSDDTHADHILGRTWPYSKQTRAGVGVVRSKEDPRLFYFVFLSAPPNPSENPPFWVLKKPSGKIIATTGKNPTKAFLVSLGAKK